LDIEANKQRAFIQFSPGFQQEIRSDRTRATTISKRNVEDTGVGDIIVAISLFRMSIIPLPVIEPTLLLLSIQSVNPCIPHTPGIAL
jgi:hypothetical protein